MFNVISSNFSAYYVGWLDGWMVKWLKVLKRLDG
jgi:hypothetical protein